MWMTCIPQTMNPNIKLLMNLFNATPSDSHLLHQISPSLLLQLGRSKSLIPLFPPPSSSHCHHLTKPKLLKTSNKWAAKCIPTYEGIPCPHIAPRKSGKLSRREVKFHKLVTWLSACIRASNFQDESIGQKTHRKLRASNTGRLQTRANSLHYDLLHTQLCENLLHFQALPAMILL